MFSRKLSSLTAAMLLAALLLAAGQAAEAAESGTWAETKVNFGGFERDYALYTPSTWKRGGPLVVFFHGFTLGYQEYRKGSGFIEACEENGTALLMPNALAMDPKGGAWLLNPRVWDMGQLKNRKVFVDDSAFVDRLIKDVVAQIGADASKIFISGHSNGAYFAHFMAGKFPGRFAGMASLMGRYYKTAMPKSIPPIPTIIFNGFEDQIIPIEGKSGKQPWEDIVPAQQSIDGWAAMMGLESEPSKQLIEAGGYQLAYKDALGRVMLVAVYIENQGHWIPGHRGSSIQAFISGPVNMSYDATKKMWDMFMSVGSNGLKLI